MFLRYDADLRRVWVCGLRFHHGFAGALFVLGGAWLCWDDRHDFPWLQDEPPIKGASNG